MKDFGLVSIIMPCYNASRYIGDAIESVLSQTYTNWELLVTDDCSMDNSTEIVGHYSQLDVRIRLLKMKENEGAAKARNNSIRNAKGKYIAFLDSDDWWYPNKLEVQLDFMVKHQYEFVFSAFEYADEQLNVTGVSYKPNRISFSAMKIGCNIGTPGVVYDTERIGKIYMPSIKTGEDWGTWLQIVKLTKYAYALNVPLWKYRKTTGTLSANKLGMVENNIKMYQNVLGYSKLKSILFFFILFLPNHFMKLLKNKIDGVKYKK